MKSEEEIRKILQEEKDQLAEIEKHYSSKLIDGYVNTSRGFMLALEWVLKDD